MATSLAEQLQKLKAPQTSLLLQDKKRASLLFDPKEAANYDRQTIYELGVAGLDELKTLNARFSEFEATLFDLSSQSFERAVQSTDVNKKLNNNIKKFFYLLSPYFLLKPAHKALEWLINRFHIHQYNVDDLIMLALPYHESRIFVRIVQLVNVAEESNHWHWLAPLQKQGIPLSKHVLLNHASSSPAFLRLLCDTTLGAVKEHGQYAVVLSTLLAFYSTTLLGVLDQSKGGASERQIVAILDALQRGLKSSVLDFAAASYVVVGRLVVTTSLSNNILNQIINRITKTHHTELQIEKAMLLVLIFQSQKRVLKEVPFQTMLRLASQKDTAATFGVLSAKGYDVVPFVIPLLRGAIEVIQTQIAGDTSDVRSLIVNVLNEVHFNESAAELVIRTFIEEFDISKLEEAAAHQPLVAIGEVNTPQEVTHWYSRILLQLERSYPSIFDKAVCRALKGLGINESQASTLKQMLGFELQLDLFDKLHHAESKIRAEALLCLAKQSSMLQEKDEQTLKDSLLDVLKDESAVVVQAALSFPVNDLQRILTQSSLHSALVRILQMHILSKGSNSKWADVIPRVISVLTELDKGNSMQELESLVSLLPHMILEDKHVEAVLASPMGTQNNFLKLLKGDLTESKSFRGCISNVIKLKPEVFPVEFLLEYGQKVLLEGSQISSLQSKFILLMLLGASVPSNSSADRSLEILQLASRVIEGQKLSACSEKSDISAKSLPKCLLMCHKDSFPVEGYLHVVQTIIHRTKLTAVLKNGPWIDLEDQSPEIKLLVQLYCALSAGCTTEGSNIQSAFVTSLKLFFKIYFPSPQNQVEFLSNFWTSHCVVNCSTTQDNKLSLNVQVRSLRLGALLLSKCEDIRWATALADNNITVPALLVALSCPANPVRKAALSVVAVLSKSLQSENSFSFLIKQIQDSVQELNLDARQLQLILYTSLSPDRVVQNLLVPDDRAVAPNILNTLLDIVLSKKTPPYISASVLVTLTSVNSKDILRKLLSLVLEIMSMCKNANSLNYHHSAILCNVVNRIDSQTAEIFKSEPLWTVMSQLLTNQSTDVIQDDGKKTCPAELACSQVTRELWESLPAPQAQHQQRLLSLLVSAGAEAENPMVLSAVGRSVKQLTIDASLIVTELNKMKDVSVAQGNANQQRRRSLVSPPSIQVLQTKEWCCGMTLLELLQNKKKLTNVHLLLPVLFDILKKCLYFEEQAPVEYAKQLVLSCILHCCQKLSPTGVPLSENIVSPQVLEVEAVVNCVRGTQNPQTHHHALLLLAHMAAMVPEQVLLNIMAIFTFMGSLVLRQDDAYSFQIISKIVDTIIPILINASQSGTLPNSASSRLEATIASVMRVFVDALLDIPEHRRLSLFHRLLTTLDPKQYLWLFLSLVMESHTMHHSESTNDNKKGRTVGADSEAPKRIEVALQIVTKFDPDTILLNCVKLLKHLLSLPIEKGADNRKLLSQHAAALGNLDKFRVKSLFDVDHHTPKQFRHYKYTLVTFLSALLSSLPFVNQITIMDENATSTLVPVYMEMLEVLLAFIQVSSRQSDLSVGTPTAKYWRVMVAQAHDILDKVNALLPSKLFLSVVSGLMTHELPSLRRKAMELLNSRLSSSQRETFLTSCDNEDLLALLDPLLGIVKSIETPQPEETNDEIFLNQQTALLSIKYLAKQLAFDNFVKFKPILENMTSLIRTGQIKNSNLLASVVLCAAELCSSLRAHAIYSLPVLMPAFIKLLASQIAEAPGVVQVSLAASLYRIVESLASFLSPYLHPLLVELCGLSASYLNDEEDQGRSANLAGKLKSTRQKLASSIPTRVLVPAVEKAYKDLIKKKQFDAIGPLLSVLAESFVGLVSADIAALQTTVTDFFLSALQFRSSCKDDVSVHQIDEVETHVVKALVAFVLKLSETSFRPLYFKLYDWATRLKEHKERTITFYKLSCGIAECLKGLFVSFSGHFLKNAASLLDQCNVSKVGEEDEKDISLLESNNHRFEELYFGSSEGAEENCSSLVNSILRTLHFVFLYDSQNFLSKERFETLMQPIVDQLENTLGGVEGLRQRATDILVPCISQLAVACTDDTLWKLLNYQLLLKTRHSTPMVRLVALEAVCGVARKLGEGFLPLLPETVPFLAELLEDEEETIENACRRAVQDLEQVLGEPIQKYF